MIGLSQRCRSGSIALVAICASFCAGGDAPVERRLPNIVLVSIDTLRADHLGCYGYERDTSPVIDALAAESIVFESCLSPLAATLPAHTSLFTGAYPLEHGVLGNVKGGGRRFVANPALRLFAEYASERGYRTAGFVSAVSVSAETGVAGGFDHYDEPDEIKRRAGETNERLLPWIDRLENDRPFFLFVHYFDPHWSYAPPEPFDALFAEDTGFLEDYISEREIAEEAIRPNQSILPTRETINGYDGEIRYADTELGRVFERLRQRGLWDDTLVIFLGDHGEGLGEHGQIGHGWIHREQLHVPLMMRLPGHAPRRVATPMSLVDVMPTALGLIGTEGWEGFLRQATGNDVLAEGFVPQSVFSQRSARERDDLPGQVYALTAEPWKYVHDSTRGDRLFDWSSDPFELTDLLERESDRAERLKRELLERIELYELRGRAFGELPTDRPMDAETIEKLRSLGYLD
jgi:arylsulfatase